MSLFIDPRKDQIKIAKDMGADMIELHTGEYANASGANRIKKLRELKEAVAFSKRVGFFDIAAGHGLTLENVKKVAAINDIIEFNIGHSIISQSVFLGLRRAVLEMKRAIRDARK